MLPHSIGTPKNSTTTLYQFSKFNFTPKICNFVSLSLSLSLNLCVSLTFPSVLRFPLLFHSKVSVFIETNQPTFLPHSATFFFSLSFSSHFPTIQTPPQDFPEKIHSPHFPEKQDRIGAWPRRIHQPKPPRLWKGTKGDESESTWHNTTTQDETFDLHLNKPKTTKTKEKQKQKKNKTNPIWVFLKLTWREETVGGSLRGEKRSQRIVSALLRPIIGFCTRSFSLSLWFSSSTTMLLTELSCFPNLKLALL